MGHPNMRPRLILGGVLPAGAVALFFLWFGQSTDWVRDRVVSALTSGLPARSNWGRSSCRCSLAPAPPAPA
jgi:hypothetical protein